MILPTSHQIIPPAQMAEHAGEYSRPPSELSDMNIGDTSELTFHATKAPWPVNIDKFARDYVESALRTETDDYQQANNRVAIVVGEGAFNTTILYIPEDTILLTDISRGACNYMQAYVDALRIEPSSFLWKRRMQPVWESQTYQIPETVDTAFDNQIRQWNDSGYSHAFSDEDTYYRAHLAAQAKAIIPVHMDFKNVDHVSKLAVELNRRNATVTFANFTNLIDIAYRCRADNFAEVVACLPFSKFAPILASYVQLPTPAEKAQGIESNAVHGPFFGLPNLVRSYNHTSW